MSTIRILDGVSYVADRERPACVVACPPMSDIEPADPRECQVANLRTRLGFTVVGIDAGRFRTPSDAVDEILATLASTHPPHREELLAWIEMLPEVES